MASLTSDLAADLDRLIEIRRDLHRHPELGYQERRTSAVVERELRALGIPCASGLAGGTGVLASLDATVDPSRAPTIALRADLDALPIHEETGKPYASENAGVMHACGHDGHTAILLGAARLLSRLERRPNNVLFLFQPAEENGAGARRMVEDGALDGKVLGRPADCVYGLHGDPFTAIGQVATRTGPIMAAADGFRMSVQGRGAHAAMPHESRDPIVAAAHLIVALQTMVSRRVDPTDSCVVTVGSIHGGEAGNVIPEQVRLSGTLRTLRDSTRTTARAGIEAMARAVCDAHGTSVAIEWQDGYPATVNHPATTDRFREVARQKLGDGGVVEMDAPCMGAEDFAFYCREVPATFFFLGLRPEGQDAYANLHSPHFDFNDDAIPIGVELMCSLALEGQVGACGGPSA